jgi:uroporphyrinogen-III synthase
VSDQPVVVVTRDERENRELSHALAALGARAVVLQTTAIAPARDLQPLRTALAELSRFDWLVFTSAHAVGVTCADEAWRPAWAGVERRPRVAAVGPRTAARLAASDVPVDLVPDDASAAGLARAMAAGGSLAGARVLWPRSDIARRELPEALARAGAQVVAPEAYRTLPVLPANLGAVLADVQAHRVDAIVFMSPSSASALAAAVPGGSLACLGEHTVVASIGPTTSARLAHLGVQPAVEAATPSARTLAEAVVRALARREAGTR